MHKTGYFPSVARPIQFNAGRVPCQVLGLMELLYTLEPAWWSLNKCGGFSVDGLVMKDSINLYQSGFSNVMEQG